MSAHLNDPDLLAGFLDEAGECVATLNARLLAAESGGGTEEVVGEMFRAAHSMKGAAGFLNLGEIARVTHALETVLDRVRKGTLPLGPEVTEALFAALDTVSALLAELSGGAGEPADVDAAVARLDALVADGAPAPAAGPGEAAPAPGGTGGEAADGDAAGASEPADEIANLPPELAPGVTLDDVLETLIARNAGETPLALIIPLHAILESGADPLAVYHGLEAALRLQTVLPLAEGADSPWQPLGAYDYRIGILAFAPGGGVREALTAAGLPEAEVHPLCVEGDEAAPWRFVHPERLQLGTPVPTLAVKEDMRRHLSTWAAESREELQALEDALVAYEAEPLQRAHLHEIFRLLHRLKGSSASMGLEEMGRVAHNAESLLSQLREARGAPEERTFQLLYAVRDYLLECLTRVEAGRTESPAAGELDAAFRATLESGSAAAPAPSLFDGWPLDEADRTRLAEEPAGPGPLLRVGVLLDPETPLPDLRYAMILRKLAAEGRVLVARPSLDALEAGMESPPPLRVIVGGPDTERVREIVEVDMVIRAEVDPLPVDPGDAPAPATAAESGEAAPEGTSPAPAAGAVRDGAPRNGVVQDTIRVDTARLDAMMNVAGELAITKARVTQLAGDVARGLQAIDPRVVEFLLWQARQAESEGRASGLGGDTVRQVEQWAADLKAARDRAVRLREATVVLHRHTSDLQASVMRIRMVPIGPLFQRFHRLVRDLARDRDRQARLETAGEATELDKRLIDELADPLTHLIRNAVDHGLEPPEARRAAGKPEQGTVRLEAFHEGGQICIRVRDDGKGLDAERIRAKAVRNGLCTAEAAERLGPAETYALIFEPGFSTAESVTNISGRGVGMDIVRSKVNELKGRIEIESTPGQGTAFTIRLPLTLAMIDALLVEVGGGRYALPLESVREIVELAPGEIHPVEGKGEAICLRENVIALVDLEHTVGLAPLRRGDGCVRAVVTKGGRETMALAVDRVIGDEEIVVKPLSPEFESVQGVSGATVLGDGGIALILDVETIGERARAGTKTEAPAAAAV